MESKIMVTIPCQFSSSWSSNKCHVCLLATEKHCVSVAARRPFRKSPIHQNFLQAWPWAFSKKKKNTLPVSQGTERMRLVLSSSWAFWYRWFSLCKKTLHTIHTHTHSTVKESCLAWFVVADHEEVKRKWRKSRACCFVWENVPFWNCRLFTTSCFDFSTMIENCWSKNCTNLLSSNSWSECSSSTSRLIWSLKRHFIAIDLPVAEITPKCICYPILGQSQGQQRRQAARLKESAKQLLFWSGQWSSDRSCSATDGSFDIGLGKTLGIGEFPSLDQSASVYLYWPPGPFQATQYDKEPGGAGFEAKRRPNDRLNKRRPTFDENKILTNCQTVAFDEIFRWRKFLAIQ